MKVTIIGGGIIGLCSAYYLKKEGLEVSVIDTGNITDGCSFGNMGYVSPRHFIPLASPGIIAEGLKYLIKSDSPFYIKPQLNFDFIKWIYFFWKNCSVDNVKKNAPHLFRFLQLSRDLMYDFTRDLSNDFYLEEKGCLMMYQSDKAEKHELAFADTALKFGLKPERLDRSQVQSLEPDVEINIKGAVMFKEDCHLHPGKFMTALKEYLIKKNVSFILDSAVENFETRNDKISSVITAKEKFSTDYVLLSCGSWLPLLAKKIGIKLLLQPGKGYSYTYQHVNKNIRYPSILVDDRSAITPWSNILRIGGTMELSGINDKILIKRMEGIYNAVRKFYPGLEIPYPIPEKIWCGLRPISPDGLPYIGKHSKYENLVIAGGHAMIGMSLGFGTGKLVSEIISKKKLSIQVDAFKVERYDRFIRKTA